MARLKTRTQRYKLRLTPNEKKNYPLDLRHDNDRAGEFVTLQQQRERMGKATNQKISPAYQIGSD